MNQSTKIVFESKNISIQRAPLYENYFLLVFFYQTISAKSGRKKTARGEREH